MRDSYLLPVLLNKIANFWTMLTITTPTIEFKNRGLTHTQLQQVIDYIHTYIDRDLSLIELASAINISPTYFASLFKQTTGISPHQ